MQNAKELKLNLVYVVVINHPIFSNTPGARHLGVVPASRLNKVQYLSAGHTVVSMLITVL